MGLAGNRTAQPRRGETPLSWSEMWRRSAADLSIMIYTHGSRRGLQIVRRYAASRSFALRGYRSSTASRLADRPPLRGYRSSTASRLADRPPLRGWARHLALRGQAGDYFVHSLAICDSTFTGTVVRYSSPAAHIVRSTVWATAGASSSSTSTTISS